ncbi:MAG: PEP-utilizing enzyme, partial [Chloroflexota bacterium]|nr:PEP-utilizing enzyme [Chloroflexota bacterium]
PEAVERAAGLLIDPPTMAAEKVADVEVVAAGLGASPGLASGAIATTPETAVRMAEAGTDVLLVRSETSPDDVHGMARSVGILTTTGGLASHAAVVARGWDIPAVVGAVGVVVGEGAVAIGEQLYHEGDVLSIDGGTGEVFGGAVESMITVVPEAVTLLAWAGELGIEIKPEEGAEVSAAGVPAGDGVPATDDVVRALAIKGYVMPDMLAPALGVPPDEAQELLDRLVADGIAKESGGMFSLTDDGKALGVEMIASDRESWGPAEAEAALDGFLELDGRMKIIVTAWQMKEVAGEQVLNDHADADYDAGVLAQLAALHADATAWITPLIEALPRLASYGKRLDTAAAAAAGGDPLYIASPRVDCYHGTWFELHEDLIRLAGKSREEEVAAGRA